MEIQLEKKHDNEADEVWFSPWLKSEFPSIYDNLTRILDKHHVPYKLIPCTNDYWCRDYMPVQTDLNRYVCYRYYPDYLLKNPSDKKYITDTRKVCWKMNLEAEFTDIIIDGGNVVKAGNMVIMTEKVFAENSGIPVRELTARLETLFGCKIIFLPWDRNEIFGHADGILKPISEDTVLMTNYNDFDAGYYEEFNARLSEHFKVRTLRYDVPHKDERNWAYINFISVSNLIILPKLNIAEDGQALEQIKTYYPQCEVEQVDIETLVKKGGGLNCVSWCRKTK